MQLEFGRKERKLVHTFDAEICRSSCVAELIQCQTSVSAGIRQLQIVHQQRTRAVALKFR